MPIRTLLLVYLCCAELTAQAQSGALRGTLTDNSGAVIPDAVVTLLSPQGDRSATTRIDGVYSFSAVPPGEYTLRVAFPGFGLYEKALSITTGQKLELPVRLAVTAEKQEVTVKGDPGTGVSVEADNNANSLVMKGQDLDALPDDQGDLNDMLQALAGPGAGPDGGQLYVDGFSGGKLPQHDS